MQNLFIKKILTSSLIKSSGIYTFTNIINSAIPFLLMPVLTQYLSPSDYGITAMLQVLIGVVSPFIGINAEGAVNIKFFQKDKINFPKYVSSCFVILICSTVLMSILFVFFHSYICSLSEFPKEWLWSVLFICFGQFIILVLLVILQASGQPMKYGVLQVLQTSMNLGVTLGLVILLHFNWQGRIIGQTISIGIFSIFSLIVLFKCKWIVFDYDKHYIKDALKFGVPLIPHALAGFLMVMTDRIIITNLAGLSETGIYSVGAQIGMAIGLLGNSFNQAYAPWLFNKLGKITQKTKSKIVKFTYVYMVVIIIIAVIFSFIMPFFLKYFIGKQFYSASSFILWIALGYAFDGMYKMVVNYIFYIEKTHILAWITFFTSLIHVFITYIFIKMNGTVGAAQATTVTYFLKFTLTWVLSNKVYPMPWFELRSIFNK